MGNATQSKTKRLKVCPHCGSVLPPKHVAPKREEPPHLTPRQEKVLRLIARGLTCTQIGEELGISRRTAEFHRKMVLSILGMNSTAALTLYAASHGLL